MVKVEKVNAGTNFNKIREAAITLGIKFVGVSKPDLIEQINAKIDEQGVAATSEDNDQPTNQEESTMEEVKGQEQKAVVETTEVVATTEEVTVEPAAETVEQPATEATTEEVTNTVEVTVEADKKDEPAATKQKWHEKEGAMPYKKGDRVIILEASKAKNGDRVPILFEREAEIVEPSRKEGTVRAILVNDKTGELQKCTITLKLSGIAPKEGYVFTTPQEQPKAETAAPEVEVTVTASNDEGNGEEKAS